MKILYNWLKDFVDVAAPPDELRSRLSLSGTAIDSIEETPAGPVLDAEVTANRPDCLGHLGMAREVAAIYRLPVKAPHPKLHESTAHVLDTMRVEIDAPDLCVRYTARVLRGVNVQPSPDWLRQRLAAMGQNSINNVVDVTNYVMFELGQPLHAFDLDKLREKRIVIRRAKPGEKIRTLDGGERALTKEMCVIADAARAIAVGGVMGGTDSEIGSSSQSILLESASFDPIAIRRTSKALGLRTEASYRFERGVDPHLAELASRRAAELIQQVSGGELLAGVIDVYPAPKVAMPLQLSREEIIRVMGADIPDRDVEEILAALGFQPKRMNASAASEPVWKCQQPTWRADVTRGIDLVEEVARHYGYDKFPPRLPPANRPAHRLPHASAMDRLRDCVIALGYQEIVDIPLVDATRDALFRPGGVAPAVIGNPLAEDASVMRSNGIASMLGTLEWNLNRGQRDLKLFEIGKAYEMRNGEPLEIPILTFGATGLAREKTIHESAREFIFADLKGDLDVIGQLVGGLRWQPGGPDWLTPALAAQVSVMRGEGADGGLKSLGIAGQVAHRAAEHFKLRQNIFVAELRLEPLLLAIERHRASLSFNPLARFPAVQRDFSLVLSDGVTFEQVADAIRSLGISELQSVETADLFRGGQIPSGKFSLMIRVTFQSSESTLTEAQVADSSSRILATLGKKLGGALRSN